MRTNIDIDDKLMKQAMKATGAATKKAAVEASMRLAVQMHKQEEALKGLWGIGWEGNLDEMRRSRFPDWDRNEEQTNNRKRKSAA
jgi:Arc/MetJ family transcription regulator